MVDVGLYFVYILLVGAIGTSIVFSVINALKTPGVFIKSMIGVGVLVVLFVLSYAISSSDVTIDQAALGVTGSSAKLVGAGLIMLYIVSAAGLGSVIYSEVNKVLK